MNLSHYSAEPVLIPRSTEQRNRRWDKPEGLWVSVDGEQDWPTFCRDEEYEDLTSKTHHRVTLADDANVLVLTTAEDVTTFSARFSSGRPHAIDWAAVSEGYQGIIIAPYQWSLRLSHNCGWYYTWDCASGCIWDSDAIASIVALTPARAA